MVRLIFLTFFTVLVTGCANKALVSDRIQYDFIIPPEYPLSKEYRYIHVAFEDKELTLPEDTLAFEALKLTYTKSRSKADIVAYLNMSPSYLVHRSPITRQVIEYDENDKGQVRYVMMNRGYIRTPYSVEVVDMKKDALIFQTQGAGNFDIDALPDSDPKQTASLIQKAFYTQRKDARKQLVDKLWNNLKKYYLKDVVVSFGQLEFNVLTEHDKEPKIKQAYLLLKENNRKSASKALALYNQALKRFQELGGEEPPDDIKEIIRYINQGITAASSIANHPNQSRFN